ncbi:MAG: S8 family serine peptidase, partial [Candidatus Peribacteraceae bacterium]|nr:S8 family serine peptidase [Candidatus Peribacteraceae bacterium]
MSVSYIYNELKYTSSQQKIIVNCHWHACGKLLAIAHSRKWGLDRYDISIGVYVLSLLESDSELTSILNDFTWGRVLVDDQGQELLYTPRTVLISGELNSENLRQWLGGAHNSSLLNDNSALLYFQSNRDAFAYIDQAIKEVTPYSVELDLIDFQAEELTPFANAIIEEAFGEFTYLRKVSGEVVSYNKVLSEYTVRYGEITGEDPVDSLESIGLIVNDIDQEHGVAIVSVEAPSPDENNLSVLSDFIYIITSLTTGQKDEASAIEQAFPVAIDETGNKVMFYPFSAIVSLDDETNISQATSLIVNNGFIIEEIISDTTYIISCNEKLFFETLTQLSAEINIILAEPNFINFQPEETLTNKDYAPQFVNWHLTAVSSEKTWNITQGSENVIGVIIDVGVDLGSPFLEGAIVDRGNENWNFLPNISRSPNETLRSHGTSVAGIMASQHKNTSYLGIAPDCKIVPIKAWKKALKTSTLLRIVNYLNHYAQRNTDKRFVVNMSFGSSKSEAVGFAIKKGFNTGIVYIASAGNKSQEDIPHYPSDYKCVISVGGLQKNDIFASGYSNYGNGIDLTAPGGEDFSRENTNNIRILKSNGKLAYGSGTSYAAPHVTAAAMLIYSRAIEVGKEIS